LKIIERSSNNHSLSSTLRTVQCGNTMFVVFQATLPGQPVVCTDCGVVHKKCTEFNALSFCNRLKYNHIVFTKMLRN